MSRVKLIHAQMTDMQMKIDEIDRRIRDDVLLYRTYMLYRKYRSEENSDKVIQDWSEDIEKKLMIAPRSSPVWTIADGINLSRTRELLVERHRSLCEQYEGGEEYDVGGYNL